MPESVKRNLIESARQAARNSYSPYSHFPVGAAVLGLSGKTYSGTNVENASYGLTICAERSAVSAAVSAGERQMKALAVYTPAEEPQPPCGACLQVISEFADGNIPVFMFSEKQERWSTLDQLLPFRFKLKAKEK